MHDPDVVAFEIRRPWPQRTREHDWRPRGHPVRWSMTWGAFWTLNRRGFYWPPMITIWHREPGGRDSGEVCKHYVRLPEGKVKITRGWRLHVHHWRVQVHPAQELRRCLLTRCAWCGGRHRKDDPVNVSHSWDGPRGRWWQGEPGLYHGNCSAIFGAHATCVCDDPALEHATYGRCARCDRFRPFGITDESLARARELSLIPAGERGRIHRAQSPSRGPL